MSARAQLAAAAAAVGGVALLVATGLGWWNGSPAEGGGGPALAATASLAPRTALFGDPVVAEVDVQLDRRAVDDGALRVEPGFAPYAETGAPAVLRLRAGRHETVRYRYTLQCVSDACLPGAKGRTIAFPPVAVLAGSRKATAAWPPLEVESRLAAADLASSTPHFHRDLALPPPAYAVAPGAFAGGLTAAAAVLGLAAAALLAVEAARFAAGRRRRAGDELTPLELALARAREAATRLDPADRRKAVGALAQALAAEGRPGLAASAGDVAWSEAPPSPARTLTLVDEVEASEAGG